MSCCVVCQHKNLVPAVRFELTHYLGLNQAPLPVGIGGRYYEETRWLYTSGPYGACSLQTRCGSDQPPYHVDIHGHGVIEVSGRDGNRNRIAAASHLILTLQPSYEGNHRNQGPQDGMRIILFPKGSRCISENLVAILGFEPRLKRV